MSGRSLLAVFLWTQRHAIFVVRTGGNMSRPVLLSALLHLALCAPAGAEPIVYVINEGSGSVSIIETRTDKVSATIKVGERPRGLAVSTDGERLYVSHQDGTLIERDMYAKAESGGAKLGSAPSSIDLSPDGKLLAAAIQGNAEIVLLDPATMRVTKKIPVRSGERPANAVFSPDGRWLYASSEESPELQVIDVKQGAVTSINVGPRSHGIAFLPDGSRAYVAAGQHGEVVVIDVAHQAVLARVKTAGAPFGVTAHPDGKRVFVSVSGAGKVQVLDTGASRIVAEFDAGNGPSSMALTPDPPRLRYVPPPHSPNALSRPGTELLWMMLSEQVSVISDTSS
jgi:YVTN family beta-propeller protein